MIVSASVSNRVSSLRNTGSSAMPELSLRLARSTAGGVAFVCHNEAMPFEASVNFFPSEITYSVSFPSLWGGAAKVFSPYTTLSGVMLKCWNKVLDSFLVSICCWSRRVITCLVISPSASLTVGISRLYKTKLLLTILRGFLLVACHTRAGRRAGLVAS